MNDVNGYDDSDDHGCVNRNDYNHDDQGRLVNMIDWYNSDDGVVVAKSMMSECYNNSIYHSTGCR